MPQYQEVGPYTFRAKEVRYNLQYDTNWTEVSYTYHQYAEFLPEESCPTCTMDAPLTLVNRAYLQFLASAGPTAQVDAESAVIYQLMPITLSVVENAMETAIQMADPASTTIAQDALMQWTDCSFLEVSNENQFHNTQTAFLDLICF